MLRVAQICYYNKIMRFYLVLLGLIILFSFYLYYSYTNFFDFISSHHLNPPEITSYEISFKNLNEESIKYVALGDSLTAGTGVENYKNTYPYIVASNLGNIAKKVNIINLGVPGAKIVDYKFNENSTSDASIITVLIGTNDVFDFTPVSEFEKKYNEFIKNLASKTNAEIVLINIPYLGSSKIAFPLYSFIWDLRINQYNNVIKKIADENLIGLIDLYIKTKQKFDQNNNLYSSDQFHPSEKGYELFGSIINESKYFQP